MADLYFSGYQNDKVLKISNWSTTVLDSFSTAGFTTDPHGIEWTKGGDFYIASYIDDFIYQTSGFSSTITDSLDYTSGGDDPDAVSSDLDGSVIWHQDNGNNIILNSGFSTTVKDSFDSSGLSNNPNGVTWNSIDVYVSCSGATDKSFQTSGFSSTVLDSIDHSGLTASPIPVGCSWTGTNYLLSELTDDVLYEFSGFTTTILNSVDVSTLDVNPWGISHPDADERLAPPVTPQMLYINTAIGETRFTPGIQNFVKPKLIDFGKRYGGGGGCYRIFGDAEYRFYWDTGTPPVEGSTPDETNDTFNGYETTALFGNGDHRISASNFNGLLDSGFGNVGNNGERYKRLLIESDNAVNLPPSAPMDWRLEQRAGVTWIYGLYQEYNSPAPDASAVVRAEEWSIAYTINGSTPPVDTPSITPEFRGNMAEVLKYPLPVQAHGITVKVRLQTRRLDGAVWVYSELDSVLSLVIDTVGPDAPPGGSTWRGAIPEDAL